MAEFTVVIPARYQSSRFVGKPLVDILGQSMIERTWRQAKQSAAADVVIATDDQRIYQHCQALGANVVMTSPSHPSGTDRIQEVCRLLALPSEHIVVNVQGDEPCIPPEIIDQVANLLANSAASVATLVKRIKSKSQFDNANVVKAVLANANDDGAQALYFSRAPVPLVRDDQHAFEHARAHIGIYAYKVSALNEFVTWPEASLEQVEKLEQLRFLANGHQIVAALALQEPPTGVDSPDDVQTIIDWLNN